MLLTTKSIAETVASVSSSFLKLERIFACWRGIGLGEISTLFDHLLDRQANTEQEKERKESSCCLKKGLAKALDAIASDPFFAVTFVNNSR